jgi:hypothetical protein
VRGLSLAHFPHFLSPISYFLLFACFLVQYSYCLLHTLAFQLHKWYIRDIISSGRPFAAPPVEVNLYARPQGGL